ncbi:uncharacterized protein LOC113040299 isoform X2 [Carassius auratus]|nr:uncharacterized protein LOC113040299 isoform X2 [Carassius auratus]
MLSLVLYWRSSPASFSTKLAVYLMPNTLIRRSIISHIYFLSPSQHTDKMYKEFTCILFDWHPFQEVGNQITAAVSSGHRYVPDMALKMMGSCVLILFVFLVEGVFGDEVKSVKEGDRVALNTGVTKQQLDMMRWYFNDVLIALINGDPSTSCLYDGEDGRFRDRLKVDYQTGSLIITNITTQHTGRYEAEIIRSESSGKRQNLNRSPKCNSTKIIPKSSIFVGKIIKSFSLTVNGSGSGLSPAAVAGIVVCVLLLAAAVVGVMIYFSRRSRKDKKKNKQVLE